MFTRALCFICLLGASASSQGVWKPDNGDGTYTNPVIFADYSDPDVVRVGRDFFLVSSSFNCTPVIPVLHSNDLVNWTIVGHVAENLPSAIYDRPHHGDGCWAPAFRFHNGEYYVYYGDPDLGIFMTKSKNPAGPWEPIVCIREAKGWIDPCPFWDDNGGAYLVHAWARSRAGFNSILTVSRMSADGRRILDSGTVVFDGHAHHPTIEGPKFYKRNGWYYIFAPAGGVANGWQTVLRSKNVFGPYEDRIVLDRGATNVNGPHQGGWVETESGESWFVHFQERGAYGRIIHLEPMKWIDDWPVIGADPDGDGKGEPVGRWTKPNVGRIYPDAVPQTSDEFDTPELGLQWQWQANHRDDWYSLNSRKGMLRLQSIAGETGTVDLWNVPNLLLQKFSAPDFTVTTRMIVHPENAGEKSGLVVMGYDYSYTAIEKREDGFHLLRKTCRDAENGSAEVVEADIPISDTTIILRLNVDSTAACRFSYSTDDSFFIPIGGKFTARGGGWIGAKVGLFCVSAPGSGKHGYADIDWFRIQ